MIINKIYNKNNYKLMAEKYVELLDSGISPNAILVLTFNRNTRKNIIKNILKTTKKTSLSELKITTFGGLIYNTISDNWTELEPKIKNGSPKIQPHLTGLELSQYLLKQIIREETVKGYNSKKSLLHQIFRRYTLISKNNLTPKEVEEKSNILKEAFGEDADKIIKKYQLTTLNFRAFDNLRQSQIFSYIYKNTDYFKDIKYLIADSIDEATPLLIDFIRTIKPQLTDEMIILDKNGGTRRGYLCAEPFATEQIEEIFNKKTIDTDSEPDNVVALKNNIFNNEHSPIKNLYTSSLSKRIEMVETTVTKINSLISDGVAPKDISIITPIQDNLLRFTLKSELKKCNPIFLTGSDKLIDNQLVKAILTVIKLSMNQPVEEYELRIVLIKYLHIPLKVLGPNFADSNSTYSKKYDELHELVDYLKKSDMTLSEKAYYTYTKLIDKVDKKDLEKFNFFLDELQEFEQVFKGREPLNFDEEIVNQIESSIISDNPYSTLDISDNDLIISTPQLIIDKCITTKYQFWLDTSSIEWIKSDIGPLYNSWVFQKSWNGKEYTIEDNIRLTNEKIYRILRKLMLHTEKIYTLSCLFDTQGIENYGAIEQYLIPEDTEIISSEDKKEFKITPRDDQKPVLEYKSGTMAISAVPGAGKTTILLALIIELMKQDIEPEKIWVLTYMDSAARNFKDRIKTIGLPSLTMPNISTIHGLALKILKENSNHERLGLPSDFDICDDSMRGSILKSLSQGMKRQELDEFDKAISVLKFSGADLNSAEFSRLLNLKKGNYKDIKLSKFLIFFVNYQKKLKSENLIDYDDILISAVKLLEENPDIREYYQDMCHYIIEDEAQDSSALQQRLINLLGAKHKNIIRCGDVNQAITTTFTNADVEGFKRFINNSETKVNMNRSQRCAKGIWELANRVLQWGNNCDFTPFYEIYMQPVENKNPTEQDPLKVNIYKTEHEEKTQTVKTIKEILRKQPDSTIGVLLRNNHQINEWADFINNSGLTAITRNECLGQKNIFKVIFSILKVIAKPYDNFILAQTYKTLAECGILKPGYDEYIRNIGNKEKSADEYEKIFNPNIKLPDNFISLNNNDIKEPNLAKFHWDINYWLSFPELTIDELAIIIGLNYFSGDIEKSNIHLIATLCSKLNSGNFNETLNKLEKLSEKPNLSGFKFFSEYEEETFAGGKIQLMTLHKSKGDEFDYVFIPELSERNLSLDIESFKLWKNADFTENIKALNQHYKAKTEQELKEFIISENFRLLYVAITRAKRRLHISTSELETFFGKKQESIPCALFDLLTEYLQV